MTGKEIITRETPLGLYKGLGAVVTGIVPKMAIRFTSYDWYKQTLSSNSAGAASGQATFLGKTPFFQFPILLLVGEGWTEKKEKKEKDRKKSLNFSSRNLSRSSRWYHRSCSCRDADGSDQNPTPSSTPQLG